MKIKVGYIINFSPNQWLGGYNYFKNLLNCLDKSKVKKIEPIIITDDDKIIKNDETFSKYKILKTSLVSRSNLIQKIYSKVLIFLFGRNLFFDDFLLNNDIKILSHSGWIGNKSKILNFPWIPDLQEIHLPHNFSFLNRIIRRARILFCNKYSTKILISSTSVRKDLKSISLSAYKNSILIKHSVEVPHPNKIRTFKYLKKKYKISKDYFFLPNHYWIHKNHFTVLKSLCVNNFHKKRYEIISTGATFDHRHPNHFLNIKKFIKSNKLTKNYKILGIVPYIDLVSLIYHSLAVINPSLSEGWSNTVEQAKALNKKTIISNIRVHREQKNNNSVLFNPHDYKKLKKILDQRYKNYKKIKSLKKFKYYDTNLKLRNEFIESYQNKILKYL